MNTYIGNRLIKAKPMSREGYTSMRGWTLPADENGKDLGYLTEDPKGTANTLAYKGHMSWLPKLNFECEFIDLGNLADKLPHAQRLLGELAQLHEKLSSLLTFIKSDQFFKLSYKERELMLEQSRVMTRYIFILEERVAA